MANHPSAYMDMKLAGYRLDAVIGHGGMGTVFRAEQIRLRRDVALKIMAPDLASDPVFRERFLGESRIAASLEHPHVVQIFDAGEVDDVLYIAMRYMAGSDLRALIRRQCKVPAPEAVAIVQQVASALDTAHARGLVHRDVKPSNVLVEEGSAEGAPVQVCLTDFGLSKRITETSGGTLGRPLGSVHYMSPEQIQGKSVDARSDVYSLGCLLHECLTGEVPFVRDSEVAVMYAHLNSPAPRASARAQELPTSIDEVVAWALAKFPDERPSSAGEFAEAVAHVLAASSQGSLPSASTFPRSSSVQAKPPGSDGRRFSEIVGRLDEEAALLGALEQATVGRGGLVLLAGEPGIGKTTVARRLCDEAQRRGLMTAWGAGGKFGEAQPPYWHWVQVVRSLKRGSDGSRLFGELGQTATWLGAIAPELGSGSAGSAPLTSQPGSAEGRFRVYDALATLIGLAAAHSALLVVLDDLHVADEASRLALSYVAGVIEDQNVLIVGTYRERELAHARDALAGERASSLAELARSSQCISLTGLDREHVGRLIAARTGMQAPDALRERVYELTGGNPLFVDELLSLLDSKGQLGDARIASTALPLSMGLRDAISQRLAPLSPACLDALGVGAVIGTTFRAATLSAAAEVAPAELLDLLDEAVQLGLLRPVGAPGDWYTFDHGLVQATLYDALPHRRRCALHAAVGEALEKSHDVAAGAGLAEVAYHYLEAAPAGNRERAFAYARRAADHAVGAFAYDDAVSLYRSALEYADVVPERERLALMQALGETQMRAGDTDAARGTLMRAAEAARAHGDPEALAHAALACNIWGLSFGIDELLVHLSEEAVEGLEDGDSPGLLASAKGLLAAALYWSDQAERRGRLAEDALSLARAEHERAGTRDSAHVLAYVLGRFLLTRWGPDSWRDDFALSDQLLSLTREARDSELEILARNWRVCVLCEMGRFAAADQEIARIEQMATELGQPRAMVYLPLHRATRAATIGNFAEAERLNADSFETGRRVRGTVGELAGTAQLVSIRLQQGRLAELEEAIRTLANIHPGMIALQCALALILVQSGRDAEARAELERLTAGGLAGFPRDNTHIVMLAVIGEVASELNDSERARELLSWLEPYAERWVASPNAAALWPVARSLARLATVAGAYDTAIEHLERARSEAQRSGAAPSVALVALDEARLVAACGQTSERASVKSLAKQARKLAQDLGMGLVVDAATLLEA